MNITLEIEGMHCTSCASAIEKQIKKLQGIQEASVNPVTEKAHVSFEDSVTVESIVDAVSKAGYTAYLEE